MFQQPISLLQKEITWRITSCFEIFTKCSMFWCNHFQDLGNYGRDRMNSWTKTWGTSIGFYNMEPILKKKKKIEYHTQFIMLHNFEPTKNKKQKRWGRTEDKISLALVHFHISSRQLKNIILISYLLHENLTIESQVSTFFFIC